MSIGIASPPSLPQETPIVAPPTKYETFIDRRLHQTRRQVRVVDVATGLVTLAIGILGYLFTAAMVDHWVLVGGLGFWGRLLLWTGLVSIAAGYFLRQLLPPLTHRINPVFAASTIEKSHPSIRNSLINFLLLRGRQKEVAAPVYEALEQRAAADLSKVRVESAVDRTRLVHLGCVLAAIVVLFSLYMIVSPKNPLQSAARVLWPWSTIEAPTRVTIHELRPGDKTVFQGEFVTISAEIAGLREDEKPELVYSTADKQIVDQVIKLESRDGSDRYECRLPPGNLGVQQDYAYHLRAGDCLTGHFRITAQITPTIVVDRVSHHYPAYTGIADQTVERQGDVRAIEGTEVTIYATANTDIKPRTAEIDLGCTGRPGVRMTIDSRTVKGRFTLRLKRDDASRPAYDCYQLRFADPQGRENPRPTRHHIDVIHDLPPEIQVIEPRSEDIQVPEDGKLAIKVRAEDPDFALRRVMLQADRDQLGLPIAPLLEKRQPEKPHAGEFVGTYNFEPAKLGLKAGDRIRYWAEAEDNKEPQPNRSETEKQWITVVGRGRPQPQDNQEPNPGQPKSNEDQQRPKLGQQPNPNDRPNPPQPQEQNEQRNPDQQQPPDQQPQQGKNGGKEQKPAENGAAGANEPDQQQDPQDQQGGGGKSGAGKQGGKEGNDGKQNGEPQPGQSSEKAGGRVSPETQPGDAIQEILDDAQKNGQNQKQPNQKDSDQPNGKQDQYEKQPGGKQEQGEKQPGGKQDQGEKQPDGKQEQGEKQPGGKQEQGEKQPGDKQDQAEKQPGGKQGQGEKQPGDKQDQAEKQPGDKQGQGEKQPSDKQDQAEKQPGGNQEQGEKQPGDKQEQGENEQSGSDQPNKRETGANQPGAGDKGEKKADSKKDGSGSSGDQKGTADKQDSQEGNPAGEKSDGAKKPDTAEGKGEPAGEPRQSPDSGKPAPKQKSDADISDGDKSGSKSGSEKPQPKPNGTSADQQPPGQRNTDPKNTGERNPDQPSGNCENCKKPSNTQGGASGDRSANGEKGGGQGSKKSGAGDSGSHDDAKEGGSKASEKGDGETGKQPGDKSASQEPTGSEEKAASGAGADEKSGGKKNASETPDGKGNKPGEGDKGDKPGEKRADGTPGKGDSPGAGTPGTANTGNGGKPGASSNNEAKPPKPVDSPADQANIDYARKQTALALEHLRDQLAKEKPELLDRLGWSKEEARQFLARWEEMQRAAAQKGAAGDEARKQLRDALKSLGLRPRGTELRRGGTVKDKPENLRDAGHFAAPPDWADQTGAYTRGVAGADRKGK